MESVHFGEHVRVGFTLYRGDDFAGGDCLAGAVEPPLVFVPMVCALEHLELRERPGYQASGRPNPSPKSFKTQSSTHDGDVFIGDKCGSFGSQNPPEAHSEKPLMWIFPAFICEPPFSFLSPSPSATWPWKAVNLGSGRT